MNASNSLRRFFLPALLLCACLLLLREFHVRPDGRLHLSFLNVGQGDATLLQTPTGRQVLIDCGPDTALLQELGKYMSFFDRSIDLLILSHSDLDHIGGCIDVLQRYRIESVLFPEKESDDPRFAEFLALLTAQHIPVVLADPARDIDLGDGVLLDILWPTAASLARFDDRNDVSVVLKVTFENERILFTGDLGETGESALLASGTDVSATILKVGHHGSRNSSSTGFLLAVSPDTAIISAGKDNSFGHPHPMIIQRLQDKNVTIRSTMDEGTIEVGG